MTLSLEGFVQLQGVLRRELSKTTVTNMAKARFGHDKVHNSIRILPDLSSQWLSRDQIEWI